MSVSMIRLTGPDGGGGGGGGGASAAARNATSAPTEDTCGALAAPVRLPVAPVGANGTCAISWERAAAERSATSVMPVGGDHVVPDAAPAKSASSRVFPLVVFTDGATTVLDVAL